MGPKRGTPTANPPMRRGRGRGAAPPTQATPTTVPTSTQNQPTVQPPAAPAATAQVPPGTRVLAVNRRLAYPPSNRTQTYPRPQGATEEAQRFEALRNQLRHPYALTEDTLRWHLARENWDVNRAAASFRDANSQHPLPNGHPTRFTRRGRTVEASRRRAIRDTGRGTRQVDEKSAEQAAATGTNPSPSISTSFVNLADLYHQNAWDSQAVLTEVMQRSRHMNGYDDVTDRLAPMRSEPSTVVELDERLAHFVTITAVLSIYSATRFLEDNDWDVAAAIDDWARNGTVPVVRPSPRRNKVGSTISEVENRGMRAVKTNPLALLHDPDAHKDLETTDDEADDDLDSYESVGSVEFDEAPATADPGYESTGRVRTGFIIDEDRTPARLNCPDASKLRIESIAGQKYKIQYFGGSFKEGNQEKNFRWDDGNDANHANEIEFDWADPKHIYRLNRWREEYFRRATGELVREEVVPFSKYELDWLREQEAKRYEEEFFRIAGQDVHDLQPTDPVKYQKALDTFSEGTHRLPLPLMDRDMQQLTNDFNSTFAGKRFYQKVTALPDGTQKTSLKKFDKPRPTRTKQALHTQRSRTATLCRHFLKNLNNPHGEARDPDDMHSDADSDIEEYLEAAEEGEEDKDGGGDDQGAAGQGEKRAREGEEEEEDGQPSKQPRLDDEGAEEAAAEPKIKEESEDGADDEASPESFFRAASSAENDS